MRGVGAFARHGCEVTEVTRSKRFEDQVRLVYAIVGLIFRAWDTKFASRISLSDEIRYPSVNQVERLYEQIIRMIGGEHGYLSKSNLGYLLDTVKDVGERLRRKQALVKKASFLLYNIILLHPFLNGNKRTAYELVRLFLRLNGYEINSNSTEAYRFLLDVALAKVSTGDVDSG